MKNRKIRIISLLVLLTLLFSMAVSCSSCVVGSEQIYTKDELSANLLAEKNTEGTYVWEYLDSWKFPRFDGGKLRRVENIFRDFYYTDIPSAYTVAKTVAEDFIENSYDKINLADVQKVTDSLILAYVRAVGDQFSFYRTNEQYKDYTGSLSGSFVGIGVRVNTEVVDGAIHVIAPVVDSPAEKAGILAGDKITAVDGVSVTSVGYEKAVDMIKGEAGTKVKITVSRNGESIDFTIARAKVNEITVDYYIDENKIGYIDIDSFKKTTDEEFVKAINYMKENGALAVVYDVRDNGGGYLDTVLNMIDYIAPDGIALASFSNDYDDPDVSNDGHSYLVPSVIVCNGNSASASELFTSAIRDIGNMGYYKVTLVGQTTYGKGVMQNSYPLSDNSAITLTVARYYPPSKEDYNGRGILPDVIETNLNRQLIVAFEQAQTLISK